MQLQRDDRNAFEAIFQLYYSGLVVYADKILDDLKTSEDIVQSVFMKLWEDRYSLHVQTLRSYLSKSVKNRCIDLIRNQKVVGKYRDYFQIEYQEKYTEDFYTYNELSKVIDQSLEKLPPRCREIFVMSRFQHLKTNEIADKLSLSKRTVETQISNALKIMRVELKDYLFLFLTLFF